MITSAPGSPAASVISDTAPDSLVVFSLFIVLIGSLIMSLSIKGGMPLTVLFLRQSFLIPYKLCLQKLIVITFPSYFFIFITACQYTITISYAQ